MIPNSLPKLSPRSSQNGHTLKLCCFLLRSDRYTAQRLLRRSVLTSASHLLIICIQFDPEEPGNHPESKLPSKRKRAGQGENPMLQLQASHQERPAPSLHARSGAAGAGRAPLLHGPRRLAGSISASQLPRHQNHGLHLSASGRTK